ncbi:Uncharacterized protein Adt_11989 [Abeliophyllum distichum]|uniref:Uncharacterized protein n=1 Tax=Abeliophyllum distichum TaxID=126358 RepID=A0ABD1UPG5_9LAMI
MLIENIKDVNTYPLEELYRALITYEFNKVETKEKTRKSKEEMKEPPKQQNTLKLTNDEGCSNTNMSDEELDDLVLLVKKMRGFRNNQQFQKKEDKGEDKNKKIIYYNCNKPSHKRNRMSKQEEVHQKKKALQAT